MRRYLVNHTRQGKAQTHALAGVVARRNGRMEWAATLCGEIVGAVSSPFPGKRAAVTCERCRAALESERRRAAR